MAVLSSVFIGFAKEHRPESVLMPDHRLAFFPIIFSYFLCLCLLYTFHFQFDALFFVFCYLTSDIN